MPMEPYIITQEHIEQYAEHLWREEHAETTIAKYLHDLEKFAAWLNGLPATKEQVLGWKEQLCQLGRSARTVNGVLSSLNGFFAFMMWEGLQTKLLKVQRQMFRDSSRDLTREEYFRLVNAAQQRGEQRLAMLLETICGTGIRVSEVRYITVEAARNGRADIALKGKIRTILIPSKLARKLLKYAHKQKIASGEIFITKSGKSLSRRQIWGEMKRLCQAAGVDARKVFPHNLRHLFARSYYKQTHDIVKLADVLGHSSINTTRIYLIATGREHQSDLDKLGLVS